MVEYLSAELNVEELSWHYSESGHGKGAPDGVGGCLKREADSHIAHGHDILNAQDFVNCLQKRVKNINVINIDDCNVFDVEHRLQQGTIKPFKGTMRVHQLTWSRKHPHVIHARRLSCLQCSADAKCHHYEIGQIPIQTPFYKNNLLEELENQQMAENENFELNEVPEEEEELVHVHDQRQKRWKYADIYSDSSDDDNALINFKKSKTVALNHAAPSTLYTSDKWTDEPVQVEYEPSATAEVLLPSKVVQPATRSENKRLEPDGDNDSEEIF
ncbi:hypothetical protein O0L34_g7199 [Tuta absoluta]|nr:hypothetical protein O0L34_g7199 [Tuta absoluta]